MRYMRQAILLLLYIVCMLCCSTYVITSNNNKALLSCNSLSQNCSNTPNNIYLHVLQQHKVDRHSGVWSGCVFEWVGLGWVWFAAVGWSLANRLSLGRSGRVDLGWVGLVGVWGGIAAVEVVWSLPRRTEARSP